MKLITLSGLDGSGKSTQVQLLQNYLESQNKRVFYFHAIEFGLAKKLVDFRNKYCLICKLLGKCRAYKEKSVTQANALQIFLRKIFFRIDIWRFGLLRSKLLNSGYDYILSDRYFYDSIINIEYLINSKSHDHNKISGLDSRFRGNDKIIKPGPGIYLRVSPENIMDRERKPDQGLEYLEKKYKLYESAAEKWNLKIIDGNRPKEEIFEEIKKYLV